MSLPMPSTSRGCSIRQDDHDSGSQCPGLTLPRNSNATIHIIARPLPDLLNGKTPTVYALDRNLLNFWLKAKILSSTKNRVTNELDYIVEYEPTTKNHKLVHPPGVVEKGDDRQLSLKEIAYDVPTPFQLPVGVRVIAKYEGEECDKHSKGMLFAGIVGETCKSHTKNRYLIFFDFGGAQYVNKESVFMLYTSSPKVWNDVHPYSFDFIYKYIHKYPDWPLIRLQEGSFISVEWNGLWHVARVLEIDCALAKVQFENDERIEWIFRGSDRLRRKDEVLSTQDPCQHVEYLGSLKEVKVPANISRPRECIPHKCSPDCVQKYIPNAELNKLSPLAIPLFLGWSRKVGGPKEGPKCDRHLKEVHYVAPCGVKLAKPSDLREYLRITDFNLTMDFFYLKSDVNVLAEFMPAHFLFKIDDLSNGKELRPVQVINSLDHDPLPHFEYITEPEAGSGVNVGANNESQICCDCTDNCMNSSQCACVKLTKKLAVRKNIRVAYTSRRMHNVVTGGICECSSRCPCKINCPTRVVQSGSMWPLQIFKTAKKGWGVRTLHDMPAGSFIGKYTGEIINSKEAARRSRRHGSVYMASLNHVALNDNGEPLRVRFRDEDDYLNCCVKNCYEVDGRVRGNATRFLNHSCDPNVVMQNVFIDDTRDLRFPQLAFFTSEVVKAGTELVLDYGYSLEKDTKQAMYCLCGKPSCRGRLY